MTILFFHTLVSTRTLKQIKSKALTPQYSPKTPNQHKYVEALNNYDTKIVLGVGPAGTGKTLFACNTAVEQLKAGSIKKIVLTRPLVSVEEEIGFLPGNLVSKMEPWTRPIFDILEESYSKRDMDVMLQTGVIEISPLAFMRGRTFKNAFIIADEMQNSSPNQMLMITTRLGTNSKMVITGDLKQSDRMENNGLHDFIQKWKAASPVTGVELIEMESTDIKRSEIVSTVLDMYNPLPKIVAPKVEFSPKNISSSVPIFKKYSSDSALIPKDALPKRNYSASPYISNPFYC
jgi:phosphate starvation-inducible PhoH-like protein